MPSDDPLLKEVQPGSLQNVAGHVWQAKAPRDSKTALSEQPSLYAYVVATKEVLAPLTRC